MSRCTPTAGANPGPRRTRAPRARSTLGRLCRRAAPLLLALTVAGMGAMPGPAAGQTQRERRYGQGLTLNFDPADRTLADQLWPALLADRAEIMERLGLYPEGTIRVLLAVDGDEFFAAVPNAPPSALGLYLSGPRAIVLRSPRGLAPGEWDIRGVARHELVHAILDLAIDDPLPTWLNEGLAMLVAGEFSFLDDTELSLAVVANRLIPFGQLVESFPDQDRRRELAYREAASFTRFLLARGGMYGIEALVRHMAEHHTPSQALELVYGYSLEQLEQLWKRDLAARLSWWSVLASSSLLGVVGAPLLLLGARRRRREARRLLEQMAQEEGDDAEPRRSSPRPYILN